MKELKETVYDMLSDDYKRRFLAEYDQLVIRTKRLDAFIQKIEGGEDVKHDCPVSMLKTQRYHMMQYLRDLSQRAKKENIELEGR